jgi:hypothetical protein
MIDAIFGQDGTLVGYRGDGLLAVFGAPITQDDHADRALAAAREMLEVRLPRFNRWLENRGLSEPFEMGIGLNSGPFMSCNVGSERALEYTVHGDTVNTASRLGNAPDAPSSWPTRPTKPCRAPLTTSTSWASSRSAGGVRRSASSHSTGSTFAETPTPLARVKKNSTARQACD